MGIMGLQQCCTLRVRYCVVCLCIAVFESASWRLSSVCNCAFDLDIVLHAFPTQELL